MMVSIDQHVNLISDTIRHLESAGIVEIEPQQAAEDDWVNHVNEVADLTVYPTCNSWYLGSNVPGKTRVFMPYVGFNTYVAKCQDVVAKGYEGFTLVPSGEKETASA